MPLDTNLLEPAMDIKFNRAAYMNRECDHDTYYRQFATPAVIDLVSEYIGVKAIMASTDPVNLNDIPLRQWDSLHDLIGMYVGGALGDSNASTHASGGRSYSLSDTVCVAKAAARVIRERHED